MASPLPPDPISTRNATVELTTPYIDPAFTFRATDVSQMFSFVTSDALDVTYDLGVPPTWSVRGGIRNNTISHALEVDIAVSPFLVLTGASHFVVEKEQAFFFTFSLNEDDARLNGHSRIRLFENDLIISVLPLEVDGPVFVRQNIEPLVV